MKKLIIAALVLVGLTCQAQKTTEKETVVVIIKDGKIENVEIVSHSETEGLGGVALPQYAAQTVEKQGLDIDVITGCTVSLDGYKEAVNDALSKAL